MFRNRTPSYGTTIYPSPTAGRTKRIGVTSLLPCVQCGAINDTRTTAWANKGDGLNANSGNPSVSADSGAGCWFCHSLKWRYEKPMKYPDDRLLPNPDLRRRR